MSTKMRFVAIMIFAFATLLLPTMSFCSETVEQEINFTAVGTLEELKSAIENGESVKLSNTIEGISENIYIIETKNITLDLNEYNIYFNKGKGFIVKGAALSIIGNGIVSEVVDGKGDYSPVQLFGDDNGSIVVIGENVTLEGWAGIMLRDSGKWNGEGSATNGSMEVIVKGTLVGYPDADNDCMGLYVNGNIFDTTNKITIESTAKVEAKGSGTSVRGMYLAGYANTVINGGIITTENTELGTGIEIRNGELTINAGDIVGSNKNSCKLNANGNGATTTNAGLAVVGHDSVLNVKVKTNGGSIKASTGVVAAATDEIGNADEAKNCTITIELENSTIESTAESNGYGVRVLDGAEVSLGNGTSVSVTDGYGIFVRGLGAETEKKTILNVEDGANITVVGENFAIAGNGLNNGKKYGNTEINITGGTIKSDGVAIYQPQVGSLNISGGTISGTSGVYLKSGSVDVTGGNIIGTGSQDDFEYTNNGAVGNGAAVVIEVDTGSYSETPIVPNISGGTFSSSEETTDLVISSIGENLTEENLVKNFISGGSFSNELDADLLKNDGEDAVGAVLNQDGVYSYFATVEEAEEKIKESGTVGTIAGITESVVEQPVKRCIVTINYGNGTKSEEVYSVGDSINTPPTPTKSGYNFLGWSITGAFDVEFPIIISETDVNITITAQWKKRSSSGGGGSSTPKYDIKIENDIENGEIELNTTTAQKGKTIIVTVIPDDGYELDEIIVRDKKDNKIGLNQEADNKFKFDMPASKVDIEVAFREIENEENIIDEEKDDNQEKPKDNQEKIKAVVLTLNQKEAKLFGQTVENDVAPMLKQDRIVLPARFILEALGAKVNWNNEQKTVIITKNNLKIQIVMDSNEALVNDKVKILDVPAFIENNRTYLPIRFIAENLGAKVIWDNNTKQVNIFN